MRTPVKEGHPSPIRSPASASPAHRSRPHTHQGSPGKGHGSPSKGHGERSRSPKHKGKSPERTKEAEDGDYDDDFEEATDNVTSLEEEGIKSKNRIMT